MLEPSRSIRYPLRLRIGFSRCLLALLCFIHIGAILCVFLTDLPDLLQVFFSALIIKCLNDTLRKHLFWQHRLLPSSFVMQHHQLYLDDENLATISSSYVQSFWVLLRLRLPQGQQETLLICADSITAEEFRQLRVRLKHPETRE